MTLDQPDYPIVTIDGAEYRVVSFGPPCVTGRCYHYHEEEHPGVAPSVSHHHHDERCQRRSAVLEAVVPVELGDEIITRKYKDYRTKPTKQAKETR